MYHLFGVAPILRNLMLLGLQANERLAIRDERDLRLAYMAYLSSVQSSVTLLATGATVTTDPSVARALLAHFMQGRSDDEPVALSPGEDTPVILNPAKIAQITRGLRSLELVDKELASLFSLVINTVFFYPSKTRGGGSTPRAIGVIWCNPSKQWTGLDLQEFAVHELTHNLLFLDERVCGHYLGGAKIFEPRTYVNSSIRLSKRRADLAFHSLVVATEILCFRQRHGRHHVPYALHPRSLDLWQSAQQTAKELLTVQKNFELFTPRAIAIIHQAQEALFSLERGAACAS